MLKIPFRLLMQFKKKLNVNSSHNTTSDMMFTLETVSCLGACGIAPVVVINEVVYPLMNPAKIIDVIDQVYEKEKSNELICVN